MQNTSLRSHLLTALVALIFGFGGAALWSVSGLGHEQTRDYLLDNPEILPEMAENFQKNEARERLVGVADEVVSPFPGAILGNPEGSVTLVEFTDYGCSFCRQSREDIDALVAANPDLKVVIREWPIFEGSDQAASMALAREMAAEDIEIEAVDLSRPMVERASRDELQALRSELRKSEARVDKIEDMRTKLAKKLADPALYETSKAGELATWNKKYAEVMDGLSRAEAMWEAAQAKLDAAQARG